VLEPKDSATTFAPHCRFEFFPHPIFLPLLSLQITMTTHTCCMAMTDVGHQTSAAVAIVEVMLTCSIYLSIDC